MVAVAVAVAEKEGCWWCVESETDERLKQN